MKTRSFVTYRRHNCTKTHRLHSALARCTWPRATWVYGDGAWATIASCRRGTWQVELHRTRVEAEQALALIASSGCGGACLLRNAEPNGRHRLVYLATEVGSVRSLTKVRAA